MADSAACGATGERDRLPAGDPARDRRRGTTHGGVGRQSHDARNDVPGSFYSRPLGEEFVLVPGDTEYETRVFGTDDGRTTIQFEHARPGENAISRHESGDVPVDSGTVIRRAPCSETITIEMAAGDERTLEPTSTETLELARYLASSTPQVDEDREQPTDSPTDDGSQETRHDSSGRAPTGIRRQAVPIRMPTPAVPGSVSPARSRLFPGWRRFCGGRVPVTGTTDPGLSAAGCSRLRVSAFLAI